MAHKRAYRVNTDDHVKAVERYKLEVIEGEAPQG